MKTEVAIRDKLTNMRCEVVVGRLETPNPEGEFAMHLMGHFGIVAGVPDGEDAAGRARMALLPPEQVVQRAFDIAKLTMEELRKRNLLLTLPSIQDAEDFVRTKDDEEEKQREATRALRKER